MVSEFDTFGITLLVCDWRTLLDLSQQADRAPSDYLRLLLRREAASELNVVTRFSEGANESRQHEPAPAHT